MSANTLHQHQSRVFPRVALLLIFTLVGHIFDDCMAHFGLPTPTTPTQVISACSHLENASCDNCSLPHDHKSDSHGCHSQSEIAVRTSSFSVGHFDLNLTTTVVLPARQQLVVRASGSLLGCAEPPPMHFVSSSLRSSLPNRAPPSA